MNTTPHLPKIELSAEGIAIFDDMVAGLSIPPRDLVALRQEIIVLIGIIQKHMYCGGHEEARRAWSRASIAYTSNVVDALEENFFSSTEAQSIAP